MAEKKLSDEAQVFVVQALACFVSPSEVVKQVKEHFRVTLSLPAVLHYDPTKAQGRDLSETLTALFHECRAKFVSDLESIPCANKAVRLAAIQRVIDRGEERGASAIVLQATEQAAKEMGGVFTNKRELTGAGGGPIQTQELPPDLSGLSEDELDALERLYVKAARTAGRADAPGAESSTLSTPAGAHAGGDSGGETKAP